MKNFVHKITCVLVMCAATVAFTACSDSDNKGDGPVTGTLSVETGALKFTSGAYSKGFEVETDGTVGAIQVDVNYKGAETGWITAKVNDGDVVVTSDLVGRYTPYVPDPENPIANFFINPVYADMDPKKVPQIDMGFLFPGFIMPVTTVTGLANQLVGMMYGGGLTYFDFKDDGTIGAGYRDMLGFDMNAGPTFGSEVEFPNAETLEVLPVDAITYYTKDGKVYFAIDKEYLTYIGQAELEMNLPQIIDALLAQYPGLGIEATDDYYAIPLKYAVKDGVTTLKVDKEMMMPYMPLITSLVDAFLPDGDIEVSLDPESDPMKIPAKALVNSLLDALFNQSQSIEIGIGLTK